MKNRYAPIPEGTAINNSRECRSYPFRNHINVQSAALLGLSGLQQSLPIV
jgi:hypothetical protein